MSSIPFLLKYERRAALAPEELADLDALLEPPRTVPIHGDLVRQGERPDHSVVLLSGLAGRNHSFRDGGRQFSQLHVAGDFVDLHSFLLNTMDHSVTALTESQVAHVPHERLKRMTSRSPRLARLLWLDTLIDGAVHRQWIARMGRLSSVANFAHLLCELHERYGLVDMVRDDGFDLTLTQADLADVLGLSAVHVNRIVQELRASGAVTWDGRRLTVLDWSRLVGMAEFDPTYLQLELHDIG
jgi:CRP-like cAMP-binding protein